MPRTQLRSESIFAPGEWEDHFDKDFIEGGDFTQEVLTNQEDKSVKAYGDRDPIEYV